MNKKMSRKERQDQKFTRRIMLAGAGATLLAAGGALYYARQPGGFDVMRSPDSLDEMIVASSYDGNVIRLVPDAGQTDILVIGSTSCVFCVDMVENGLEDLVEFGRMHGLGITYLPVMTDRNSALSTVLTGCLPNHEMGDPKDFLRLTYDAAAQRAEGQSGGEIITDIAQRNDLDAEEILECIDRDTVFMRGRSDGVMSRFAVEGTPSFVVTSESYEDRFLRFRGFSGTQGMLRQLENARNS